MVFEDITLIFLFSRSLTFKCFFLKSFLHPLGATIATNNRFIMQAFVLLVTLEYCFP